MAKVAGRAFFLYIDDLAIDCEVSSSISFTEDPLEIRCKSNGKYSEFIEGGQASGEISFEGVYQTPSTNSAFSIAQKRGQILTFVWGGTEAGDEVVTGNFFLSTVEITAANDDSVTFSGSGQISGEPVFGVVTT